MSFRDRLLATLRSMQPVLDVPGVMVAGSQVPNLLQAEAAATLVVSQDVDLAVPVERHREVKAALASVRGYSPAADEPSVWVAEDPRRLEVNFIGLDADLRSAGDTYVLDDDRLPLLVFGLLSLLREGPLVDLAELRVRVPRPAGLVIEKLLTERAGLKGERDLLVALGVLMVSSEGDLDEVVEIFSGLAENQKATVTSGLTVLSMTKPLPDMPNPATARELVAGLLRRLEEVG